MEFFDLQNRRKETQSACVTNHGKPIHRLEAMLFTTQEIGSKIKHLKISIKLKIKIS